MAEETTIEQTQSQETTDQTETTVQTTDQSTLSAALGDGAKIEDKSSTEAAKTEEVKGPPEKYDFKPPEGFDLDPKALEEATPLFKELGLSQESAQKLVDFYGKHSAQSSQAAVDAWISTRTQWRDELKADPALGKELAPDGKVATTVNRALAGLQNPKLVADFKAAMDLTGAGDNPAFVRVLYALAGKVTEGTTYAQGSPVGAKGPRSAGDAIYGSKGPLGSGQRTGPAQ